jgi:hypothetical protein
MNFSDLMKDPLGIKYFEKFLETIYSSENIRFYVACTALKQITPKSPAFLEKAREICKSYIDNSADAPINIKETVKKSILQHLAVATPETLEPEIFQEASRYAHQ